MTRRLPNDDKFTTYNRDSDTGLDYAMARYYASKYGAFMSPDPGQVGASLGDPQSWNAYAYVGSDPLNFVDPTGLYIVEFIDGQYEKRYQAWKSVYLKTPYGRAIWDEIDGDPNYVLSIVIDPARGQGAESGNYMFNQDGILVASTIYLGQDADHGFSDMNHYPVTSAFGELGLPEFANFNGVLAAGKLAHELGHLLRTYEEGVRHQEQDRLIAAYGRAIGAARGNANDPGVMAIEGQLGATGAQINKWREHEAEFYTIGFLRDHYGTRMPDPIKKAINAYQRPPRW